MPGPQLGELVAGVAAGEHVEHGLEHPAAERGERRRPPDQRLQLVDRATASIATIATICWASTSSGFAGTRSASIRPSRIRSTTTAVCTRSLRYLGKSTPRDTAPTWWPGPADALQAARHARRRLDLDDEVDGAHVDAELEAGRRDHGGQPPGLELALDEGPLLLAHRAVVGAGQHRGGADRGAGLRHQRRGPHRAGLRQRLGLLAGRSCQTSLSRAVSRSASRRELANTSVERCAAIRSTTRSSTCGQIDGRRGGARGVAGEVGARARRPRGRGSAAGAEAGRAGTPGRRRGRPCRAPGRRPAGRTPWSTAAARSAPASAPAPPSQRATSSTGPHGGRQPDPLRGPLEQRVEPLQAEREVRAALGPGQRVHLVDDDRLDARERGPRLRGQQQEQRLGRRDEDVGRGARERPALVGRGVPGADADPDVGHRQPEPGRRLPDPGQRARRLRSTSTASALSGET